MFIWLLAAIIAFSILATGEHEMSWGEVIALAMACLAAAPILFLIGLGEWCYRNRI